MTRRVKYTYDRGVASISLVAGESGNAIDIDSARELLQAVLQAKADRARVILLRAEGRFFSVGGNLASVAAADDAEEALFEIADLAHRVITEFIRGDAIVVSVVQGMAAGIGFPLAAAADIVLVADDARFSLAYAKVGLSPDGGSSLLVHTLGLHRVLRLALTGDLLTAHEAFECGLASRVVPADALDTAADEVVRSILAGSRSALAATKHVFRSTATPTAEAILRREAETISRLAGTPDGKEGMEAFLSKRRPEFA